MAKEKVKTLSAMEAELRSTEYFGKGIKVASGFDLGTAAPLDSRSIVKTLSQRDKFATDKIAYEGMQVYVEEDQKQYIFKNGEWVEFGFNAGDAGDVVKGSIVNDLTTGGADKALSAEQGKVLKDLVDQLETDILENAEAIVALEARKFILTRSQEVITIEEGTLTYPISIPSGSNAIIDVIKNSVVLINGKDYTYNSTEITFTKQYSAGSQIHVLKTYNEISPAV